MNEHLEASPDAVTVRHATTESDTAPATQTPADGVMVRRAVFSSVAGTFVEYYDFAIYGAMAPIIAKVFFPQADPTAALLSTFAVFAVAFFVRPLAGLIWGRLGDRIGRRKTLVAIISLMSAATVLIGFLPSYAHVGVLAPILLVTLRLIQGISAGGELPGAAIFIAEYTPGPRRGFLTSWLQVTTTAATVSGLAFVALLQVFVSAESMVDWGWRIPFFIAGPLGLIGLYIRTKLTETPKFAATSSIDQPAKLSDPRWIRQMFVAGGLGLGPMIGFYMLLTYMPSYLGRELGFSGAQSLAVLCIAAGFAMVAMPLMARLSDRVGRRPVIMASSLTVIVLAVPSFLLMQQESAPLAVLGLVVLAIPMTGSQSIALVSALERFPTRIRYAGYALTFGLSAAIFGGTAPYLSTYLVSASGSDTAPAFYVIFAAAVSMVTAKLVSETGKSPLKA